MCNLVGRDEYWSVMKVTRLILLAVMVVLGGCSGAQKTGEIAIIERVRGADAETRHFYFQGSNEEVSRGWALLLPGSSGLTILGDSEHYFLAADVLNQHGFDALVVDYKAAYRAAKDRPDVETGGKIAWVAGRAVEWAEESGFIEEGTPGAIVAWSLGSEGVWAMGNAGGDAFARLGILGAVVYYPSVERAVESGGIRELEIPTLVLSGEADDVTTLGAIRRALSELSGDGIEIVAYPGAYHGFDVRSIGEMKQMRFPPIIGERVTFGFDADVSADAELRMVRFLERVMAQEYPGNGRQP
ncbi:MAG: dienelactone hydrolase family protein [Phycisphaerales bacterium]|nr:dienelactone hydrolase family protein [Phycisphaerales bacterium]